jgi:16S rRNA (cytosine967-C5)-methyltransferase
MTPAARLAAAIDLLDALEAAGRRPADAVAHDFFRTRRYIGGGDRRDISDRAWAIIRQRLRLDWWLEKIKARPSARFLVAAQLLLVEGMDVAAIARAFPGGQYAAAPLTVPEQKLLAVLDNARFGAEGPVHPKMPDPVRLNLPEWALPSLLARFGETLAAEAAALDQPAPLDLRANALKIDRTQAAAALAAEGLETQPTPFSPWGLRLPGRRPVTATRAYQDGLIEVQDEGSQLIAALVDARPGMKVVDLCAGAGGKTLALAAAMQNKGRITACDVSAPRLEGAVKRLARAGVDNAERHLLEAGDRWAKRRAGTFDRVLVDAPCTGTGTWRRNPDGRFRTGPRDLAELLPKQAEILGIGAGLVRPGGQLVYATCSLLAEENEDQVAAFLAANPAFAVVPLAKAWAAAGLPGEAPCPGPYMALSPAAHGTDGFFAAVLRRTAAA